MPTFYIEQLQRRFPAGMPVIIKGKSRTGLGTFATSEIVGTVVEWKYATTGAWYAKKGDPSIPNADGKLQLFRLLLKKVDGEITDLIIDDLSSIARLQAKFERKLDEVL
jgi:hypothetical protein